MSPGIRDPRLNTVECVIEGHETDITATGPLRSSYITAILWCAFIFSFCTGPFIAEVILGVLKKRVKNESLCCWCKCVRVRRSQASTTELSNLNFSSDPPQSGASPDSEENGGQETHEIILCCQVCDNQQDPIVSSVVCLSHILVCIETVILVFVFCFSKSGNAPKEIYITLVPLILEGIVLTCLEKCRSCITCNPCNKAVIRFSVTLTVYHFCWLVIGIMINPVWGLTVCLIACIFVLALTFILYQIIEPKDFQCNGGCIKHIFICFGTVCGGCSFVVLAVLAGQSFYGRETADELVKTVLLYVISGFFSWLSWKKVESSEETRRKEVLYPGEDPGEGSSDPPP